MTRQEGRLFLAAYDSVYLDTSGRVQRIRRYRRRDPNASFSLLADMQFSYPVSPSLKIEVTNGTSPTLLSDLHCYGMTSWEGSAAWVFGLPYGAIPVGAYPALYRIGQFGDSTVARYFYVNQGFVVSRRPRPGACDTFILYVGLANGPFIPSPSMSGKICHTAGRIDSIISAAANIYWFYDDNGRPIRRVDVDTSGSDTTFYTYDSWGRLIETRQSGVDTSGPYQRRFILRYRGGAGFFVICAGEGIVYFGMRSSAGGLLPASRRGLLPPCDCTTFRRPHSVASERAGRRNL